MNLPHQEPILFAKKLIKKDENSLHVKCEFPYFPTLPMLFEAAAQSSAGFSSEQKEGFLVAGSDIKLNKKVNKTELIIEVQKKINMGNMTMFDFTVEDFASGKFTIYVK